MRRHLNLFLLLPWGCAGEPQQDPAQSLFAEAHVAVRLQLRDPDSAQFRDDYAKVYLDRGVACGEVNAKNGLGGYAGFQPYYYRRGAGARLGAASEAAFGQNLMIECARYDPLG